MSQMQQSVRPAPTLSLSRAGMSEKYSPQNSPIAGNHQQFLGQGDNSSEGLNDGERGGDGQNQQIEFHYTKLHMGNPADYALLCGSLKINRLLPSLQTSLGTASLESDERKKMVKKGKD